MIPINMDYIIDAKGLISTIIGYSHPPKAFFSYPLYYPGNNGDRKFKDITYKRFRRETDDMKFFNKHGYIFSNEFSYPSLLINENDIRDVFKPCILSEEGETLIETVHKTCGIDTNSLDIIGSRLLNVFTPKSDVDVLILGKENIRKFYENLDVLFEKLNLRLPSDETVEKYAQRYSRYHNIEIEECRRLFKDDKTKLYSYDKKISFIFSYETSEVPKILTSCNEPKNRVIETECTIADASEGSMYPRHYKILIENNVFDVITHHWFFKDIAKNGDITKLKGSLRRNNLITLDQRNHYIKKVRK